MAKQNLIEVHSKEVASEEANIVMSRAAIGVRRELQSEFIAAATSDNTRRAYRSAVRHFLNWGGHLPSDQETIIDYLIEFSGTLNPRTLSLKITAISQWHKHQGFNDPCVSPQLRKILLGIERKCGRPKQKASALLHEDLEKIVLFLQTANSLKSLRDNALLQIGFFGGFRRSELVNLKLENLKWERDGVLILLPKSKTDQTGAGISKAIPYGKGVCCPCAALKKWLDSAEIRDGYLFRGINKWGQVANTGLNAASVNAILSDCAEQAGVDHLLKLSSHSLRRGMATSAYRAGANFRDIKRQGGWRFDGTVQGYIEEADQFAENAMSGLLTKSSP
ncbi:site-specific integrase [Undibacterium sp. Dicai25W]|uniref:site-specific integrase n=1 Tax=Undibacterium sp. Dicai25W TaxID=3413034 RepID=UPI003BF2D612